MDGAASAISKLLAGAGEHFQAAKTETKTEQVKTEEVKTKEVKTEAVGTEEVKAPQVEVDTKTETAAPVVDTAATGEKDTTVTQEIAPAVEHEHVKHEHETREQKVVDREIHQDHYHTTVQPLQDREVADVKENTVVDATEERKINKDKEGEKVKAQVAADQAAFKNTHDEETHETKSTEATASATSVHHHLHETIQPVIEKEVIVPELTHKIKPVHEVVTEKSVNHGVTEAKPISVNDFQGKLSGETVTKTKIDGVHTETNSAATGVVEKN
ncbi:hypothetical protein E4T44_01650 [Aureobasidium sp. EXF-8845]|nr:hypothetical protein E4T44_01650 [Aureobasidium sp. EXF-8845]KAI4856915.1 hypothetical protein E4T45_01608 [Aureobasidium sp. EXF-8846]